MSIELDTAECVRRLTGPSASDGTIRREIRRAVARKQVADELLKLDRHTLDVYMQMLVDILRFAVEQEVI